MCIGRLVKAIFFDLDDTLYDVAGPFRRTIEMDFPEYKKLPSDNLFTDFRRHGDEVFFASQRGEMSMDDMYVYRISKTLEDYNILISRDTALRFQTAYEYRQKEICISPTMKSMLEKLAESKILLGVISNGPARHQMEKMMTMGLDHYIPKERLFVSGALGVDKPDIEIFRKVEALCGVEAGSSLYVGDSFVHDVVGASKAGWKSLWFNRRGKEMPDIGIFPDETVDNEEELANRLVNLIK